jgi:hypothetical protein
VYSIYFDKGGFKIEKCTGPDCKVVFGNTSLGVNPAIKPLTEGNHLQISVIKGKLSFYINNVLQAQLANEKIASTFFGILYCYDNVMTIENLLVRIPSRSEMNQVQ